MLRLFRNNNRFIFVSCRNWQGEKKWKTFKSLVPPSILYRKMPRLCVRLEIDLLFIRSSVCSVLTVKTSSGRWQRERQKSNRLNKQNKNSALAQGDGFFLSLNLDMVFRNSPQGELAPISLHILLLIIALKCHRENQRKETLFKGRLRHCRRRSILNSLFSHIPPRRLVHKIYKYLWLFQNNNQLSCVLCRNWQRTW